MTRPGILVIDTATREALVALASAEGQVHAVDRWTAGYRHGEELLARIGALLTSTGLRLAELGGVVVGTGPGAFTGLRVGLATAKGLAHAAQLPIAGVSTATALLDAASQVTSRPLLLLLPAGPSDRVVCRHDEAPQLLPGGVDPDVRPDETVVAVDLEGRAHEDAIGLGTQARERLAEALAAIGAERLRSGRADDLATLVPEYVTLPRGVREPAPDEAVRVAGAG